MKKWWWAWMTILEGEAWMGLCVLSTWLKFAMKTCISKWHGENMDRNGESNDLERPNVSFQKVS